MPAAWTPSAAYLDRSRLRAFALKNGCADYAALLRWSTEDLDGFWAATERDLRIAWRTPYTHVLDTSRGLPWTTWWTGGRMNYVATALRHDRDRVAGLAEADEAADGAPSVGTVVVVDRVGRAYPKRGRDVAWSDVTHVGAVLDFADTSAEDPFMVIYTSGTTGKPKGAQHVHGGFPVKAAQDLAHCFDLQERDVILWSTDIGWMMGPWLIAGGLMLGATIVLYDGTPDFPDASRMCSLVQRRPVRGAVGELVIRKPWPGMTRGFWRDPPTEEGRYFQTYWSRLANTWVHGDWARIDDEGYWYIEGRSDDTLKIAGKRVGPAEVESAAVAHPAVSEAAAIGVPHEIKGEAIVVFVVPRPLHAPTPELARSVQDKVAEILGKPLRPEAVRFVPQLPKTRNAK